MVDEDRDPEKTAILLRQALDHAPPIPQFWAPTRRVTRKRKEHDQAEQMYQRALAADPTDAATLGNYARLLFILGRDEDGERRAVQALDLATAPDELPLRAECSFYLFMHAPSRRHTSGGELKALLSRGVSTADWRFADNLARVRRDEDTRAEL